MLYVFAIFFNVETKQKAMRKVIVSALLIAGLALTNASFAQVVDKSTKKEVKAVKKGNKSVQKQNMDKMQKSMKKENKMDKKDTKSDVKSMKGK